MKRAVLPGVRACGRCGVTQAPAPSRGLPGGRGWSSAPRPSHLGPSSTPTTATPPRMPQTESDRGLGRPSPSLCHFGQGPCPLSPDL